MSILNTGRQQLAQADALSKNSTSLRNELAANKAGLEIADRNAKRSARGQALGSGAAMAISAIPKEAPVGALNIGLANAPGTSGGLAQLANEGYQIGNAATAAGTGAASTGAASTAAGAGSATGAATTGAAAAETTGALAASTGAATSGAAAGSAAAGTAASTAAAGGALAGAGSAAMAAIPYVGWAAAIGSLAYSLFA